MSLLTDALNQIMSWRQRFTPEAAALLMPGLTDAEIETLVQDLPIDLPPEIYELYRWSNGSLADDRLDNSRRNNHPYIFLAKNAGFALLPLQIAVERYKEAARFMARFDRAPSEDLNRLELFFPYFMNEVGGYIVFDESREAYPIVLMYHKDGEVYSRYTSLTSMMLTLAETYEKAYFFDEEGCVIVDLKKMERIWRKHNSN